MTVLVNYYTCGYGDSFVNMFNGQPVNRKQDLAPTAFPVFVHPEFYDLPLTEQQLAWQQCLQQNFRSVPCHRQNSLDFSQVFAQHPKVITLILDNCNWLSARFKKIHLDRRGKQIGNALSNAILKKQPDSWAHVIQADYSRWLKNNLLPNDIQFKFSWIYDNQTVKKFCDEHHLAFDAAWLENIQQDIEQYVVS